MPSTAIRMSTPNSPKSFAVQVKTSNDRHCCERKFPNPLVGPTVCTGPAKVQVMPEGDAAVAMPLHWCVHQFVIHARTQRFTPRRDHVGCPANLPRGQRMATTMRHLYHR